MGHYNKYNKIEMEIFRNGKLIGYNYYFFERQGEETIITNQFKFSVDLLGTTIFEVESYGEEKYVKDQMISFESKTLQNDKKKFVSLKLNTNNKKFDILWGSKLPRNGGFWISLKKNDLSEELDYDLIFNYQL